MRAQVTRKDDRYQQQRLSDFFAPKTADEPGQAPAEAAAHGDVDIEVAPCPVCLDCSIGFCVHLHFTGCLSITHVCTCVCAQTGVYVIASMAFCHPDRDMQAISSSHDRMLFELYTDRTVYAAVQEA